MSADTPRAVRDRPRRRRHQDRLPARRSRGHRPRRGARQRRQSAGAGGARGRDDPPRRDGSRHRRTRGRAVRHRPRHGRRRSRRRRPDHAPRAAPDRLQGANGDHQRRPDRARRRRSATSPAWCSSPAPGRSPTAATPATKRPAPAAGATSWATKGSGYWIGRHALRAVVRESDGRGHATAMTPLVLAHFGVTRPEELVRVVYDGALRPSAIAAVARAVQAAAEAGDEVALQILTVGARELAGERPLRDPAPGPARRRVRRGAVRAASCTRCRGSPPRSRRRYGSWRRRCRVQLLQREPAHGAVALAVAEASGGARIRDVVRPVRQRRDRRPCRALPSRLWRQAGVGNRSAIGVDAALARAGYLPRSRRR